MSWLAAIAALLALAGIAQALGGAWLVARFVRPEYWRVSSGWQPPVTVLKPLHGDEPLLAEGLTSLCTQAYPEFQIVFGVQDPADTALPVIARLQAAFPQRDIAVVVDARQHGANRKVSNLINMLPHARHAVLAIADSDLHVQPDYLARLVEALEEPGTGLVTTLYTGLPAQPCLAARLGAMQITHSFLPGAILARAMGRQDCLGATMLLRRETLASIGGLRALVAHLADDQVLGRLVQGFGLAVRLARTVPATTVPETTLRALWRHEQRWARTIRALVPGPFAASALQYPSSWALLAILLSAGAAWSWVLFIFSWVARALAALVIDRALDPMLGVPTTAQPHPIRPANPALGTGWHVPGGDMRRGDEWRLAAEASQGLAFPCPVWLLPLRDLLSVAVILASFAGRRVDWRGHAMLADTPTPLAHASTTITSSEGPRPR